MKLALSVAVLGGCGAICRYVMDLAVTAWLGRSLPWGTMLVNITGSALGGLVLGATTANDVSTTGSTLLLVGFLGGFTTASTISYEVVRLTEARRYAPAVGVALGTLVAAFALGVAGYHLGTAAA